MSRFKVGDKVIGRDEYHDEFIGTIEEESVVYDWFVEREEDGYSWEFNEDELGFYKEPEESKFKVGDKVRCNSDFCFDPVVGIVKKIVDDDVQNNIYRVEIIAEYHDSYCESGLWPYSEDELEPYEEELTLKEMPNTVVNVRTQEEYDELMALLEKAGWTWNSGNKPSELDYWHGREMNITAHDRLGRVAGSCHEIISLDEFKKAQGIEEEETTIKLEFTVEINVKDTDVQ